MKSNAAKQILTFTYLTVRQLGLLFAQWALSYSSEKAISAACCQGSPRSRFMETQHLALYSFEKITVVTVSGKNHKSFIITWTFSQSVFSCWGKKKQTLWAGGRSLRYNSTCIIQTRLGKQTDPSTVCKGTVCQTPWNLSPRTFWPRSFFSTSISLSVRSWATPSGCWGDESQNVQFPAVWIGRHSTYKIPYISQQRPWQITRWNEEHRQRKWVTLHRVTLGSFFKQKQVCRSCPADE